MNRLLLFVFIILFFVTACRKDNGSTANSVVPGKITLAKGDHQSGIFGEVLQDTIVLKITSAEPHNQFQVSYTLIQGNGLMGAPGGYTVNSPIFLDSAGTIRLLWRMGCDNTLQKIQFNVFSKDRRNGTPFGHTASDSVIITANAVKPNGWCRSCGYGALNTLQPRIITPDNNTLYLVNYGLFSSTDGGLNWYKVKSVPYSDEVVDAHFNSKQWLYVLTKTHGIYYSKDMQQWTGINNGILDMRDPTGFLVEDTAMFVSFYFDGPYRTTDNGEFWRKLIVGDGSQRFYFFKRHPSGKLFLIDDWGYLKGSDNNGDNWPIKSLTANNVFDFQIDPQGLLYIGEDDATLRVIDLGNSNTVHSYYQWNASQQIVNNITFTNNDVYYLVNYNLTPGIYRKSNNWGIVDVGFTDQIGYYYLKNNGAFLIGSKGWLFYKQ